MYVFIYERYSFSFTGIPAQQMRAPQAPAIVMGPQNAEVEENSPVTFSCQVAGYPGKFPGCIEKPILIQLPLLAHKNNDITLI